LAIEWNDKQPIYLQLREMVVQRILDGSFAEGAPVPSVRQVASDYQINHLTVAKAYQELVEMGLLEKRRGLGMYVVPGARGLLNRTERKKFIETELPAFALRVQALGIGLDEIAQRLRDMGEKH
jgi:GntR family transcriptional regulator